MKKKKKRLGLMNRFLNGVEKVGNALPHPATLFALLALFALILSFVGGLLDWHAYPSGHRRRNTCNQLIIKIRT
ncbi:MAG: AbgT family transporter [Bacteroidales bacterium]